MNLEEYLKSIGFEEDVIEDIMVYADNQIDVPGIKKKVEFLHDLNCSPRIIRIVIEENPLFLTTEMEELRKVVDYIKEKGLEEELVNIIEVEPCFLSTSIDVIRKNEKILELLVKKENITILLKNRTQIFTYNNDFLTKRLTLLVEKGLKNKIFEIIINNIDVFDLEDDEIDFEELKK